MSKNRKRRIPVWVFGLIGLFFIGGSFFGIAYFALNAEQDREEEEAEAQEEFEGDACYVPSENLNLTTGTPHWDIALAESLDQMDDEEREEFSASFIETGDPAQNNPYWEDALEAVNEDDVPGKPLISLGTNSIIDTQETDQEYEPATITTEDIPESGVYRVEYAVTYENGSTEENAHFISNYGEDDVLATVVPKEENGELEAVEFINITPTC